MSAKKYAELIFQFEDFLSNLSSVQKTIIQNRKNYKVELDETLVYQLVSLEGKELEDILNLSSKRRWNDRQKEEQLRINNNSTLIFIISLFERFRGSLLKCSYQNNKDTVDAIKQAFLKFSKKTTIPAQKDLITDLLVRKENELYDHLHHLHGKQYELEKNLYGLRNEDLPNQIKEGLLSFQVFREIRNLLTHRGNVIDEKLKSSIRHSLPKEYQLNNEKTKELYKRLAITDVFNEEEQSKRSKKINISDVALIKLIYDLVNVSVFMLFGAFKRFPIKEEFPDIIAGFFNDSLFTCYENENKTEFLSKQINDNLFFTYKLINYSLNKFKYKTDLFYANSIAIIKSHIELESTFFIKLKIKDGTDIVSKLNEEMDSLLSKIDDDLIKIIKNSIENDDYNFIKSIKKFIDRDKSNISRIYSWSIVEMKKNSVLVSDEIKSMERADFLNKIKEASNKKQNQA